MRGEDAGAGARDPGPAHHISTRDDDNSPATDGKGKSFRLAWMPWYCGDYIAQTRHLPLAQRGALLDLTAISWCSGPLPSERTKLAAMLGATPSEFRKIWCGISSFFVRNSDGNLILPEIEKRRAQQAAAYRSRAQAGRDAAAKRMLKKQARGAVRGAA